MDDKNIKVDNTAFGDFVKRSRMADVPPGELRVVGPTNRKFAYPASFPRENPQDRKSVV